MRFAYLILAHDAFEQLARLAVRLLDGGGQDEVFIHVDAKSTLPRGWLAGLPDDVRGRVHLVAKRTEVHWGHRSQCAAMLTLIDAGIAGGFDYLHLLSGRDWPLVARTRIVGDIVAAGDRDVFVEIEDTDFAWRMDNFCFEDRSLHPGRRVLPLLWRWNAAVRRLSRAANDLYRRRGLSRSHPLGPWVKGSGWWSLPRDAALHARDALSTLETTGRMRWTQCSDEHVVQTALVNSRFEERIAGYRRFILWREGSWSPQVLRRGDVVGGADGWFGRKFDAGVDDFFYAL